MEYLVVLIPGGSFEFDEQSGLLLEIDCSEFISLDFYSSQAF